MVCAFSSLFFLYTAIEFSSSLILSIASCNVEYVSPLLELKLLSDTLGRILLSTGTSFNTGYKTELPNPPTSSFTRSAKIAIQITTIKAAIMAVVPLPFFFPPSSVSRSSLSSTIPSSSYFGILLLLYIFFTVSSESVAYYLIYFFFLLCGQFSKKFFKRMFP